MKFGHLESVKSIAIVGATGLVGQEFIEILSEFHIKIPRVRLLASIDSLGETLQVNGEDVEVEVLGEKSFDGIEVAFFSVPADVTRKYVPIARKAGCLVIDDSSCFRMDPEVPLVVPEVNGSVLRNFQGDLVATPNCSTTPVAMALKPLADQFGLQRVVVTTFQSVSGAGRAAYEELAEQTGILLNGGAAVPEAFAHRIAFNCLPWIGSQTENGNSTEEEKIIKELRKIFSLSSLKVSATAVRVPTFCGHGASVNVELKQDPGDVASLREMFDKNPGMKVLDRPEAHIYPTNVEAIGSVDTFIGRIRRDNSLSHGLNFYVITDNLRKGAALNALQILDSIYRYRRAM